MFGGVKSTCGLFTDNLLGLSSLLIGKVGSTLDLLVNKLLVGLVDKWAKEDDGSADESQAPEWDNLDEIVADEGSDKNLCILAKCLRS